jgi:hemerythrin-like domain-containing protein
MTTINEVMTRVHRVCDRHFAAAEAAVDGNDWVGAGAAWLQFVQALERHMSRDEEELLFPALEALNGPAGPTQVMRMEHGQMRALAAQAGSALAGQDAQEFFGLAETLMLLIQQHNMKEERILYPLLDRSLANAPELAAKLQLE